MPDAWGGIGSWIEHHRVLDRLAGITVGLFFALAIVMLAAAVLYWLWWTIRLCRLSNVRKFVQNPIPGLRKARIAGHEIDLTGLPAAEGETLVAIRSLNDRVETLEQALERHEDSIAQMEDVSGRLR